MTDAGVKLAAQGLRVSLGARVVLDDIGVTANWGRITGLVGPNGAGKSTLLRTLAGLIEPDGGDVTVDGTPLDGLSKPEIARLFAYLPQDRTVHWPLAVRDVVGLGRLPFRSFAAAETDHDRAVVEAAMRTMDVLRFAERSATALSGGELARVLMARALAQEPKVLLADEPAAGLDPAHQLRLFEHLAALAQQGVTVVVALHDLSLAARYCAHLVLLKEGRWLAAGPPPDVLTPALLEAAYGVRAHVGTVDGVPMVLPLSVSGRAG